MRLGPYRASCNGSRDDHFRDRDVAVDGFNIVYAEHQIMLAIAYADLSQFTEAWRCIGEVLTTMEASRERWCEAEIHRVSGEVVLKQPQRDVAKAQACFEHALATCRAQQAKSWELRAAMSMARLWRDQGKRKEARELLAPVYNWFTEGFDTADLKDAKALLEELST